MIHPTAIVHKGAELGTDVEIGAYSIIGPHVKIGDNTTIMHHVVIDGHTTLGKGNVIHPFCSIGGPPQDITYKGEDTKVIIGDHNTIREYVTINRATTKENWVTVMGNYNYIMAYAHIAHDCVLGDRIIMANVATLAGHIRVGNYAVLGGLVAVHQFVRIGAYAFIGGKTGVDRDIPPFTIAAGPRAQLYGINRRGLVRMGFGQEVLDALKNAYRLVSKRELRLKEALQRAREELPDIPEVKMFLDFYEGSKRGVLR
jgi:UDP-N-acetylglucosamine acyltransferase